MNKIAGPRDRWNSRGPEVSEKPKDDEDDDEKFEHERVLSRASSADFMLLLSAFYSRFWP
jgi:hypothetical protein